ncbi:MAG: carboxypeptidase-like regulatory domain-containing protein, partial [Myxococcota bacterium]|nr:carboxypeptidase-like regulatory domain-containing protein [Myxococcota bacterium]
MSLAFPSTCASRWATALLVTACVGCSRSWPAEEAPDLTERLGAGQVRAGVVTDTESLVGGVSAEGQVGDIKIYNDRVQFVVQSIREGSYYVSEGGGIIDADRVREPGQPGRDVVDEFTTMVGFGRILAPDTVSVISDGRDGRAIVRVEGHGTALKLLTGSVESPDLIPERDVDIRVDYVLEPDSQLLRVHSSVTWHEDEETLLTGQLIMLAQDVADGWIPGQGLEGDTVADPGWVGAVSQGNEVAIAMMATEGVFTDSSLVSSISALTPVVAAFQPNMVLGEEETTSWSTFFGVGADLATLSDAWHAARDEDTWTAAGTVTAGGTPIAGARVHLLDGDELPVTVATTDSEGAWSVQVLEGQTPTAVATGRGRGLDCDLPTGSGWFSPYAADVRKQEVL